MAKESPIDRAHRRGQILDAIIKQARTRAEQSPQDEKLVILGIINVGEKKQDAIRKINEAFDELLELAAYISLLDMARSLERISRDRIGNHIGQMKKTINDKKGKETLPVYRERLIVEREKFRGLGGIELLVQGYLGDDSATKLTAIREARNNFAHGEDVDGFPSVDRNSTRDVLNEIFDLI